MDESKLLDILNILTITRLSYRALEARGVQRDQAFALIAVADAEGRDVTAEEVRERVQRGRQLVIENNALIEQKRQSE